METIDFHSHQVGKYNLSNFVDSIVLSQLQSIIPDKVLKELLLSQGEVFGVKAEPKDDNNLAKRVKKYEKIFNIPYHLDRLKKQLFSLPSFFDFLIYLSNIYNCKPVVSEIDNIINSFIAEDATEYVRNILDREKISLALLDLVGYKKVDPPFPQDRFGLLFCPTKTILNPLWAKEKGAKNIDDALDFSDKEIKSCIKIRFSGFKSDIAYHNRSLHIEKFENSIANKAFKSLMQTKPVSKDIWETVPIYKKDSDKRNLKIYQDYMLRFCMIKAGEINVPFQFHLGVGGPGPNPDLANANPVELYKTLKDDDVKKTKIVLLHRGFPFVDETSALASQFANVYLDISIPMFYHGVFKKSLETVLEFVPPQKILYGSDAFNLPELLSYNAWFTKKELNKILLEYSSLRGWTEDKCLEVANMIFYKNAKELGAKKAIY
jgi:hypothetical protein